MSSCRPSTSAIWRRTTRRRRRWPRSARSCAPIRTTDPDEFVEAAADAEVIWLEWTPHLTRDVLHRLPRLGLAVRWGVGYDQIDVVTATELGIAVANAPSYCTEDVAEHALALMLAVSRQVVYRDRQGQAGLWRHGPAQQTRLSGSTVGVVGLGRIGRRVGQLAAAFGARVLGYDPIASTVDGPVQRVELPELLRESRLRERARAAQRRRPGTCSTPRRWPR